MQYYKKEDIPNNPLENLLWLDKDPAKLKYNEILSVLSHDKDLRENCQQLRKDDAFVSEKMKRFLEICWQEGTSESPQPSIKFLKLITDISEWKIDFSEFINLYENPNVVVEIVHNFNNQETDLLRQKNKEDEEEDEADTYAQNYINTLTGRGYDIINGKKVFDQEDYD